VKRQHRLALFRLDWHEAHRRSADGLADRLRVGSVSLVRLTYGFAYCDGINRTS
jgi:hypothetical protein